ncbi:hypothetical protein D3C74_55920 [compost metagenome]
MIHDNVEGRRNLEKRSVRLDVEIFPLDKRFKKSGHHSDQKMLLPSQWSPCNNHQLIQ